MAIVRSGGRFWLKPETMWSVNWCKAVTVECLCLKPCWCGGIFTLSVKCGSMTFSSVLAIGERREMGLYEVPRNGSLFGLGIGIILASFQIWGIWFEFIAWL